MDASQPNSPDQTDRREAAPVADPRLQATPDYGILGNEGRAVEPERALIDGRPARVVGAQLSARPSLVASAVAITSGVVLAMLIGTLTRAGRPLFQSHSSDLPHVSGVSVQASTQLDRLKPQKQAEFLLEQAVGRSGGAVEQISSRVERWHGKVSWNPQIATLTTAALNSNDMRVRESGIEVELAAYGLSKNSASLEYLLTTAHSEDHAQKVWALWALGLMGNRGVEVPRIVQLLTTHLRDSDEDSRRWAVDGLALVGSTETMASLLHAMHDDVSPVVREAAACALAQSGMFTPQKRTAIVPQLLAYTDDPSLDAQTHAWAFQALSDITHQHLPNDSVAWRSWYESRSE